VAAGAEQAIGNWHYLGCTVIPNDIAHTVAVDYAQLSNSKNRPVIAASTILSPPYKEIVRGSQDFSIV
jgi:hypothetical protein